MMNGGYGALREGAGLIELSDRGRMYATGEDRARLLHAMTTNHVQQLTPGTGCYAFFLNAQGRILGDVNILCFEDRLLLDIEPETRASLYQHLDKYIIADDVTLEDATARTFCLGLEGPAAEELLAKLGVSVPAAALAHVAGLGVLVSRISQTGGAGFRLFGDTQRKDEVTAALRSAGAQPASVEDARTVRLEHFKPRYGEDITDRTLPQETQLAAALHFSKGCYLGQEIVERIRSRAHVHRVLTGLILRGQEVPAPGAKVLFEEKEAGEITSAAYSPALGSVVGMAKLRVEAAKAGAAVTVGTLQGEVR